MSGHYILKQIISSGVTDVLLWYMLVTNFGTCSKEESPPVL